MRTIDHIVIHCSATREDCSLPVEELEKAHRRRGFRGIGYHYYIRRDGTTLNTRPLELIGAHAKGHNAHSIGICYEGGLDSEGHPADTLTPEQFEYLEQLLTKLLKLFPKAQLRGHRDMPGSVPKACPCLDCQSVFRAIL